MDVLLAFVIAYLLGSVNSAILVGRLWKNIDIRNYGSGNAGATNVLRILGKAAAATVLVGDVLKGIISIIIANYITNDMGVLLSGIGVILGHNYPLYFGFKGGKGILTSAAVIFMINWKIGILLVVIGVGIIALTRYVSLGSIIGAALYPIMVIVFDRRGITYFIFAFTIAFLAIYRHKSNIKKLLKGEESKLGKKVKLDE